MTLLEKPVHRKTRGAYSTFYARPRQIVVSLMPGDLIEFREAGTRTRVSLPVDAVMKHAIRLKCASDAAAKKKARALRRKNRGGL